MANQALDDEEVLSIRWAYDDPNSVTKKAIQRSNQDAMFAAMRAQGVGPMLAGNIGPTPRLGNGAPSSFAADGCSRSSAEKTEDVGSSIVFV